QAPAASQSFWMSKYKVFVMRHGEGAWTKENRFCSWVDQRLSEDGVKEALACGHLLREAGYHLDVVFTSLLSRSIHTAWLLLEAMGQEWVPVVKSWRLNERHYGALIGLNRAEMALNHGISDADIVNVTLPTGTPILIELDENFRPTKPMQLLGDQEAIQAAIRKVEDQGKVKQTA
ncbi:unnamed protein product, partial [Coregonus sp. 'balchen']